MGLRPMGGRVIPSSSRSVREGDWTASWRRRKLGLGSSVFIVSCLFRLLGFALEFFGLGFASLVVRTHEDTAGIEQDHDELVIFLKRVYSSMFFFCVCSWTRSRKRFHMADTESSHCYTLVAGLCGYP